MTHIAWYDVLRWAHLLAGIFAFVVAPLVLASRKGSGAHRLLGRLYFFPMSFAAASAAVLAAARANTTFVFIGIFSLYLGYSGFRALTFKPGFRAGTRDAVVFGIAAAFFVVMLAYAASQASTNLGAAIPLVAFGVVGLTLAIGDLRRLRTDRGAASWFFGHMTGMVASYIAAVSAFSVVNLASLPLPVRILWPPLAGIPLLLLLLRRTWKWRLARAPLATLVDLRDS